MKRSVVNSKTVALAKLGLMALIDEATGYQEERVKDRKALRKEYRKIVKDNSNAKNK